MQYSEWYLPTTANTGLDWINDAEHLANLGISHVWCHLPFKATNEKMLAMVFTIFLDSRRLHQKGTVRTKHGFKEAPSSSHSSPKSTGNSTYGRCGAQSPRLQPITWKPRVTGGPWGSYCSTKFEPFTINGWPTSLMVAKTPTMTSTGTGTTFTGYTTMPSAVSLAFT